MPGRLGLGERWPVASDIPHHVRHAGARSQMHADDRPQLLAHRPEVVPRSENKEGNGYGIPGKVTAWAPQVGDPADFLEHQADIKERGKAAAG